MTTTTTEYVWRGTGPEPTPPPCLGSATRIACLFDYYSEAFGEDLLVDVFGEYEGSREFLDQGVTSLIDEIMAEFSGILKRETIGYSAEQRPIQAISF